MEREHCERKIALCKRRTPNVTGLFTKTWNTSSCCFARLNVRKNIRLFWSQHATQPQVQAMAICNSCRGVSSGGWAGVAGEAGPHHPAADVAPPATHAGILVTLVLNSVRDDERQIHAQSCRFFKTCCTLHRPNKLNRTPQPAGWQRETFWTKPQWSSQAVECLPSNQPSRQQQSFNDLLHL